MIGWAELIKKFIGLDVVWGARSKKLTGIQDRRNTITEVVTFTAPNVITFTTAVPPWMQTQGSNGKAIRVMNDGSHPNSDKKYYVAAILGPNSVQVTPANPAVDAMVNYSGLTKISGRIWEVVKDPNLCYSDREGNTVYNLHHKEKGANDGGDVSLVQADHFHGRIITHTHNAAGWPNVGLQFSPVPDGMGGYELRHVETPVQPGVVISNDGNVIKV